jgi:hypothetical protein
MNRIQLLEQLDYSLVKEKKKMTMISSCRLEANGVILIYVPINDGPPVPPSK